MKSTLARSESPPATGNDWALTFHDRVDSTQGLARGRPPWSAVVAHEQTAGRGQAARTFTSDAGGLYVTAVLPYAGDALVARGFALAVGWAVREALLDLGVPAIRLRWPNDLMVETRKIGGVLVEQGGPDTLLVGVGLNVTNRPWLADPTLEATAGRLAEAAPAGTVFDHARLAEMVLQAIRTAHDVFLARRLAGFVTILNECWGLPREVEIEAVAGVRLPVARGYFRGIAADGSLQLETAEGRLRDVPAHHVGRLREVF